MIVQIRIVTEGGRDRTKQNAISGLRVGSKGCTAGCENAWSCCRKGYNCPRNEEGFEDMVRKRQQYISHVTEDENLPQEVEDFKELQIIKGIERIIWDGVCVCLDLCKHDKSRDDVIPWSFKGKFQYWYLCSQILVILRKSFGFGPVDHLSWGRLQLSTDWDRYFTCLTTSREGSLQRQTLLLKS